jgi:putative transposase
MSKRAMRFYPTNYPTDVTHAEWKTLEPLVVRAAGSEGRLADMDLRAIVNALLYMNRTGCQWRMIPSDFPSKGAIRYYFDKWTADGTLVTINDALRKAVRTAMDRDPEPSLALIDSQSVKTTEVGGERGYDGGKKIKGRKRQFLTDTNGFLLRILVHPADVSDTEGGEWLLNEQHKVLPRLAIIRADGGYKEGLRAWMEENTAIELITIEKPADQQGFAVIPKRWVVERSIAWAGSNRRASKEYERNTA